jgi:hypothetical protein
MTTAADSPAVTKALAEIHMWECVLRPGHPVWARIDQAIRTSTDLDAITARMHLSIVTSIEKATRAFVANLADALDADIIEFDPATRPEGLADTTTHGWFASEPEPCLYFPAGQRLIDRWIAAQGIAHSLGVAA